jgi:hypothetical protein
MRFCEISKTKHPYRISKGCFVPAQVLPALIPVCLRTCGTFRGAFVSARILFAWDHDPEQEVDEQARHAARDEGKDHAEAEPKWTDTKEFTQPTTHACDHAVPA